MNFYLLRGLEVSGKEDITTSCLQSEPNALNVVFLIDVFLNLCSYLVLYIYNWKIYPDVLLLDVFLFILQIKILLTYLLTYLTHGITKKWEGKNVLTMVVLQMLNCALSWKYKNETKLLPSKTAFKLKMPMLQSNLCLTLTLFETLKQKLKHLTIFQVFTGRPSDLLCRAVFVISFHLAGLERAELWALR